MHIEWFTINRSLFMLLIALHTIGTDIVVGWIHRSTLKQKNVEELNECKYLGVSDEGLEIERKGKKTILPVSV